MDRIALEEQACDEPSVGMKVVQEYHKDYELAENKKPLQVSS